MLDTGSLCQGRLCLALLDTRSVTAAAQEGLCLALLDARSLSGRDSEFIPNEHAYISQSVSQSARLCLALPDTGSVCLALLDTRPLPSEDFAAAAAAAAVATAVNPAKIYENGTHHRL